MFKLEEINIILELLQKELNWLNTTKLYYKEEPDVLNKVIGETYKEKIDLLNRVIEKLKNLKVA